MSLIKQKPSFPPPTLQQSHPQSVALGSVLETFSFLHLLIQILGEKGKTGYYLLQTPLNEVMNELPNEQPNAVG